VLFLIIGYTQGVTAATRFHSEEIALLQQFLSEESIEPDFLNWQLLVNEEEEGDPTGWNADNEAWEFFSGLEWTEGNENKRLVSLEWFNRELGGQLDLSAMTLLRSVNCGGNSIHTLILPDKMEYLEELNCEYNILTELDLPSEMPQLASLMCGYNLLKEIILPDGLPALSGFFCEFNQLSFVEILRLKEYGAEDFVYAPQVMELTVYPGESVQMDKLGLYTGENTTEYEWEDGSGGSLPRLFKIPSNWKGGEEYLMKLRHYDLDGFWEEFGEYELVLKVISQSGSPYYMITLSAASGIELINDEEGSYDIKEGNSFILNFTLTDPEATIADILCLVDGQEVEVTNKGDGQYRCQLEDITSDHTIHIAMRSYLVTIPETEGIVISPVAGPYRIAYGDPFEFSITLDEAYSESEVKVFANDHELKGKALSDHTISYQMEEIVEAVEITIEGIKQNTTANQELPSVRIYSSNGNLIIETLEICRVQIYTISGQLRYAQEISGQVSIPLSQGVYILQIKDTWQKVFVK